MLRALDGLERLKGLDLAARPVRRAVRNLPLGRFRDVLHGLPLGHPLHPLLVQAPIGAWLSAGLLDAVPGTRRGARVLVGAGVLAAVPAALAGWVDWAEQQPRQARTGLAHALTVNVATGLYATSWLQRGRGHTARGKALGWAGLGVVAVGGLLGGHLAYRQAAGTNKTEPVPHLLADRWYDLGRVEDFPVGQAVRRELGEVPVLVVRRSGGRIHVLADRCSHQSGPLSEGKITDGCVECPWHGSVFRLADGANVRGPATAPQPSFEVDVQADGAVRVRLPEA
nr:Rieske (2Fe-2S) protein [Streptomyces sp. NRRL F-4489]